MPDCCISDASRTRPSGATSWRITFVGNSSDGAEPAGRRHGEETLPDPRCRGREPDLTPVRRPRKAKHVGELARQRPLSARHIHDPHATSGVIDDRMLGEGDAAAIR